jgi:diguanylate cyclase (GGDEF)-like protein
MILSPPYTFPSTHLEMAFLSSINSIAMYPVSEKRFQLISKKPEWLDLLGSCMNGRQLVLNQPESSLQNFLVDAKHFWQSGNNGSLLSGKWTQTDAQGIERPFAAIATFLMAQPILLLQHVNESYLEIGRILQYAREGAIRHENNEHLIYKDFITGLYNRRGFLQQAEQALLVARTRQLPVTIASIDLDCLRSINDKYGYKTGDKFIIDAANLLKSVFRKEDILGRVGEDVFLALIPNINSEQTLFFNARLNQTIDNWNTYHEPTMQISCSIGFSSDDEMLKPLGHLVSEADLNKRKTKRSKNYLAMALYAAV